MVETLKPCPFCGGEAELVAGAHRDGGYIENFAFVRCKGCGARSYEFHECMTPDEVQGYVSGTWNRRAERTCNVEPSHVEQEIGGYSYLEVELSCGHAFTWDDGTPPDYCPSCGAKVVDEL